MSLPTYLAARTHPRTSGWTTQIAVLLAAALVGTLLGLLLMLADHASWQDTRQLTATVTGTSDKGLLADTTRGQVVLHLPAVPVSGTRLTVEVAPDGRARPLSYRKDLPSGTRSAVGLVVLSIALVQAYRFAVTRRTT